MDSGSQQQILTAPYGSWESPITADLVAASGKILDGFTLDSHSNLLWLESRPSQSGRLVIVREADKIGELPIDVTPKGFSVRSTVQEYGGAAFNVCGDFLVFSNFQDQRLYKQSLCSKDSRPVPLTPDYGEPLVRYADGVFDTTFNRYVAVREDHRKNGKQPNTEIVSIELEYMQDIQEPKVLVRGSDFYAFPRLDPKDQRLAWIEWSHPNMPWDKAQLYVGCLSETGDIYKRTCVAGADPSLVESPTEPKWSSKGELFFITDRNNGFWNIYKWVEHEKEIQAVCSVNAEFTRPLWVFGMSSYDFVQKSEQGNIIACSYRKNGKSYLGIIDEVQNSFSTVDVPFSYIANIVSGGQFLYIEGASAVIPVSLAKVTLSNQKSAVVDFQIIWSSLDSKPYESYFSIPELIEFPTNVADKTAYAFFYPPSNPKYKLNKEEKPPLLLQSHGGPTDEAHGILDLNIQYYTSRGWAFVDVNYGGSSGYGRDYRERLLGSWGTVDVDDCCSCVKFLVDEGKVDSARLCITGCSAGGYTTLATLAFREIFKAGASLFGIADLSSLSADMHKFESHYISNLAGNEAALYDLSPINSVEKFSCPIILFQGLEDSVVNPEQACKIHTALKKKGLPVALVEYEGESHGFRKAENIKFTLEQQMVFFARTVGQFNVADNITPILIDNFD
ncbi:putative Acylamino-acid-releasing enzyme [Heracleum sosnowskyi]|uniref:Acylamino-acid-releasing enzyme n=1 Tax=Heracleum sosnowskyi TaxID=360622 RepID=A0AAD8MEB9_9APIA|nr:putative Acylamino-acid-releasing enzyme [Heracleum sosnowskyi]